MAFQNHARHGPPKQTNLHITPDDGMISLAPPEVV
jgi:hypothetical protein